MNKKMYLKFPSIFDKEEYIKYQKNEHNTEINYDEWLNNLIKRSSQIENIGEDVPRTIYFLTDGSNIYGQCSIRHTINNPRLRKYVGHIGYEIRKKDRKKGYGNLLLKLSLEKCMELGLKKVMISCKKDNIASAKIIEKNGGILEKQIYVEEENSVFNIYWINI